ncbi:hypothetical protein BD779DRAFT_1441926, partial [Infundibulicybe gibba]
MTKIVNTLSAKMEMGSPMVCMYLLGHPDHYKSHEFALFYWQSYVREARRFWHEDDIHCEMMAPDKVALIKRHGRIVGLSPVYDYIYRPVELSDMCLYDWIRRCSRVKLPNKSAKPKVAESESDMDAMEDEQTTSDIDTNLEDDMSSCEPEVGKATAVNAEEMGLFVMLACHPLADTHCTRCVWEKDALVPNFAGPMLPRPDQGDREYYCSVMLSFFKPWRSGKALKSKEESWDTAFLRYRFSKRQEELMVNFNLRYECLDARDDFQAQLRAGAVNAPNWIDGRDDVFANEGPENENNIEGNSEGVQLTEFDHDVGQVGKRQSKRQRDMLAMRSVMTLSGWVDAVTVPNKLNHTSHVIGNANKTAAMWRSEILDLKQAMIDLR